MAEQPSRPASPRWARARFVWVAGAVVVVAALAGALVWWLGGSSPDEVDLDRLTADEVEDATNDGADGFDGSWVVDRDVVVFDGEAGEGSFVGYRVDEELAGIGATTAVGRTPGVDGRIRVEDGTVTSAEVVADLTRLTSDDRRRDNRVRSTLSADSEARFVLTEPIETIELDPAGGVTSMSAAGELTIEGVTQHVDVSMQAIRQDHHVAIAGSVPIMLSDFEVEAPSAPIVLAVSDEAIVEWQLHLVPESG